VARIRSKYRIKNTMGYSLNAFLDFDTPLSILWHLLVGSEGTLGFIAEAVFRTVPDLPLKSTGLLLFPSVPAACEAIDPLRRSGAKALELMDRSSLTSVEGRPGIPELDPLFRAGSPERITTALTTLPRDTAPQPKASVGGSEQDEPESVPQRGSLSGALHASGAGEPPTTVITLTPLKGKYKARHAKHRVIEQRDRQFAPRVMVVPVGSTVTFPNFDPVFHNVHSASTAGNNFNFSQPSAGLVREIVLKGPDVMLRVKCDVHSWMISYIAVEPHQYFAVSGEDGSFVIADVPAGRHSVHVWHERYGELTQMVTVAAGQKVTADFAYTGQEKPGRARMQEVVVPAA